MGLGDFFKGAGHVAGAVGGAVGRAAGDVVGAAENTAKAANWAAHHVDEAAKGTWAATKFVGEHTGEIVGGTAKGVGFLASHPQYWDDAAKQMVKDQFTPTNIAITAGLLAATVATGGAAGVGLAAKLGKGVEEVGMAGRALKGVAEVAEAGEAGKAAASAAELGRAGKFASELKSIRGGISEAKGFAKIDEAMGAFGKAKGAAREAVGLGRETFVQQGRTALAKKALPGVMERAAARESGEYVAETGVKGVMQGARESLEKTAFRKIEGGYGQARSEAQSSWSTAQNRVGWLQSQAERPMQLRDLPGKAVRGRNYLHMAAHPEDVEGNLVGLGENYLTKHPETLTKGLQFGGKTLAKHLPGGGAAEGKGKDKKPKEDKPAWTDPYINQYAGYEAASLHLDDTPSTTHLGPVKNYDAGRGFRSPASQGVDWSKTMPDDDLLQKSPY